VSHDSAGLRFSMSRTFFSRPIGTGGCSSFTSSIIASLSYCHGSLPCHGKSLFVGNDFFNAHLFEFLFQPIDELPRCHCVEFHALPDPAFIGGICASQEISFFLSHLVVVPVQKLVCRVFSLSVNVFFALQPHFVHVVEPQS